MMKLVKVLHFFGMLFGFRKKKKKFSKGQADEIYPHF